MSWALPARKPENPADRVERLYGATTEAPARDQECADLGDWVSEMFGWVWEAEADWRLNDRIDLATGTIRTLARERPQVHHTCSLPPQPQWSWSSHECPSCHQKWQFRGNGWWPVA